MRLPRRVPWASITELDEVCSWIFGDDCDIQSQTLAVQRVRIVVPLSSLALTLCKLSAWGAITTLPHALESTLALLTVILHDHSSPSSSSFLHLRQSYAAAILRLVNGLVDPLQLGAYARSIASIAAQLGLPSWLVELRHAATHEDLPSLQVLREAAKEVSRLNVHRCLSLTFPRSPCRGCSTITFSLHLTR
jgi:ribosomal biogenesis protein LAS1